MQLCGAICGCGGGVREGKMLLAQLSPCFQLFPLILTLSVAFLYANNEVTEWEIKKTILLTIGSKKNKNPGINLTKEGCKRPLLGKL